MAAIALLKFTQGATVGAAGRALIVLDDLTPVQVDNGGDNAHVKSWRIELLYAPPGSTLERPPASPAVLAENANSAVPYATFVPDVGRPGCYRIRLTVWTDVNYGGASDIDIRNVGVITPHLSFILPPYQDLPRPRPLEGSGEPGEKPNELNFDGQRFGWSGDHAGIRRLVNEALLHLDSLSVVSGFDWQNSVLSHTVSSPPPTPGSGDRYLIPTGATGVWTGYDDYLAEYNSLTTTWMFTPPNPGMATNVEDVNKYYSYNGSSWVLFSSLEGWNQPIDPGDNYKVAFALNGQIQWTSSLKVNAAQTGIEFGTASIVGSSGDLVHNVATGRAHIFQVNNVEVARFDAGSSNVLRFPGVGAPIIKQDSAIGAYNTFTIEAQACGASGYSTDLRLKGGAAFVPTSGSGSYGGSCFLVGSPGSFAVGTGIGGVGGSIWATAGDGGGGVTGAGGDGGSAQVYAGAGGSCAPGFSSAGGNVVLRAGAGGGTTPVSGDVVFNVGANEFTRFRKTSTYSQIICSAGLALNVAAVNSLIVGSTTAASMSGVADGYVLSYDSVSGQAEWRALAGSGASPPTVGQAYQIAYANSTSDDLDYAANVKINSGETGIEFGTASIVGLSNDLVYDVASSEAHIFKVNGAEAARFELSPSFGLQLGAGTTNPVLVQRAPRPTSGNGYLLSILGGNANTSGNGGELIVGSGLPAGTGVAGFLTFKSGNDNVFRYSAFSGGYFELGVGAVWPSTGKLRVPTGFDCWASNGAGGQLNVFSTAGSQLYMGTSSTLVEVSSNLINFRAPSTLVLVLGSTTAASMAGIADGYVLSYDNATSQAEWRAPSGGASPPTTGEAYQVAYANSTSDDLDYAANVKINSGETGIEFGTASIVGVSSNLEFNVATSQAHIFKVNSVEVARIDDQGTSPRVLLAPDGQLAATYSSTAYSLVKMDGNSPIYSSFDLHTYYRGRDIYIEAAETRSIAISVAASSTSGGDISISAGGSIGTTPNQAGSVSINAGGVTSTAIPGDVIFRLGAYEVLRFVGADRGLFQFYRDLTKVELLHQARSTAGHGATLTIQAQDGYQTSGDYNGGNLLLISGKLRGTGVDGVIAFTIGGSTGVGVATFRRDYTSLSPTGAAVANSGSLRVPYNWGIYTRTSGGTTYRLIEGQNDIYVGTYAGAIGEVILQAAAGIRVANSATAWTLVQPTALTFHADGATYISRDTHSSGSGTSLIIAGQNAAAGNFNGGAVIVSAGVKTGTGSNGEVQLATGGSTRVAIGDNYLELKNVSTAPGTPSSAGRDYVEGGKRRYIGLDGTITTLAVA